MKNKIQEIWKNLTPQQKRAASLLFVAGIVLIICAIGYKVSRSNTVQTAKAEEKKKEITLDPKLLEKSMYMESKKELSARDEKISELQKQVDAIMKLKESVSDREAVKSLSDTVPIPPPSFQQKNFSIPPPPPPAMFPEQPGEQKTSPLQQKQQDAFIGGIEVVTNSSASSMKIDQDKKHEDQPDKNDKKKQTQTVYLPPSFMEATLLSGLRAQTVEGAKGQPAPVLLRIKNLAILPNQVKANLKGCFVIAEGYGSLDDERVHLRLVSLSCISKKGSSVIDQKIKGFVVDEDGMIGLSGNVVSKMGSAIARSVLAGLFGGLGDAIKVAYTTTSMSVAGTTTTMEPADIGKVAVGGGIAQGASDLRKFYLDLAKQTMPVVEVGATKTVTLVVSEGVNLEIKETCIGGDKCEK